MPDLHNQAVSSTDFLDLRPAIWDAIDSSIAKILQIRDDAGPLSPERFKRVGRETLEVCMDLGQRILSCVPIVLQFRPGMSRPGFAFDAPRSRPEA